MRGRPLGRRRSEKKAVGSMLSERIVSDEIRFLSRRNSENLKKLRPDREVKRLGLWACDRRDRVLKQLYGYLALCCGYLAVSNYACLTDGSVFEKPAGKYLKGC